MPFLIIALLAILFVCTLCAAAWITTKKARKLSSEPLKSDQATADRYALRLQKMIQCQTISVKDSFDDTEFAKLRNVMAELFPLVHQHAQIMIFGDDCWMYRLKGRDESRNIMLMSHHDVVKATGEWKYPPFSGEIAEGKVWGRGTADTKAPLFAEFSALEELLSQGAELPCNVWIGSSHNEELGGDGVPKANEYFKANGISFEVILDEGGAIIDPPLAGMKCKKCAMVAVHEKGRYRLLCTASGKATHTGLTAATSLAPVERMAAFIHQVTAKNMFIRRINPQVKGMFTHLAPYCGFPMNVIMSNLWLFGGILKRIMPKLNAQAGGMIGTTCNFYNIQTDEATKTCTTTAVFKSVDYTDMKADLAAFTNLAEKYGITTEISPESEYHEPADMTRPQFGYMMDCIAAIFPQYPAAPYILPAGTDARTFTDICPCVLRFAPIHLSSCQLASIHAENENIDVDTLPTAVEFYKYFVSNYR